jgi:hypothetical protein
MLQVHKLSRPKLADGNVKRGMRPKGQKQQPLGLEELEIKK